MECNISILCLARLQGRKHFPFSLLYDFPLMDYVYHFKAIGWIAL